MISFDNEYARLPERFWRKVAPAQVRAPKLVALNRELAALLGLDAAWLASDEGAAVLAGNVVPEGASSIALAYAGHQFGGFVPQLGDGRAIQMGEVVGTDGVRRDVQWKGSGRTPFSRGGDGRAALGPVLREYVVSEAMFALGIPTTRSLAAVTTGEMVLREDALPGAVLTRVAKSHVRVGTFEFFAARKDHEALQHLVTHTLGRLYPDARGTGNDALALLDRLIGAQAELVARWMGVGFVHGVMNTDNTSLSGETLDYGPCAFLDEYRATKKFSSIDQQGRYAFGNQPNIALWNLSRFAETLLELIHPEEAASVELATDRLQTFGARFENAYLAVMRNKLGLSKIDADDDSLVSDLLERMEASCLDFTRFFRALCDVAGASDATRDEQLRTMAKHFVEPGAWYDWAGRWQTRLSTESSTPEERAASMRRSNPLYIPRNHRIEQMIVAATSGDFAPFERLNRVLARPYDEQPDAADLTEAPLDVERVTRTFCGT